MIVMQVLIMIMEINTKENGKIIKDLVKVLIILMMEGYGMANGKMMSG